MATLGQRMHNHTINLFGYKKFNDEKSIATKPDFDDCKIKNASQSLMKTGKAVLVNEV
jgi:hypothetical protein